MIQYEYRSENLGNLHDLCAALGTGALVGWEVVTTAHNGGHYLVVLLRRPKSVDQLIGVSKLREKMDTYLKTADTKTKVEVYNTAHGFAANELNAFLSWLELDRSA